jgi:hypothetical protein
MPNLLQSLGHTSLTATSPTPPLTPTTPGGEELFFRVHGTEGMPLGSPSEPSFIPRKTLAAKKVIRPKATPFILPAGLGSVGNGDASGDGYFAIPTATMTSERPSRRRSSTSTSSAYSTDYEEENWTIEKTDFGNGGLNNAVEASTDSSEKVYVGTLGYGTDALDEGKKVAIEGRLREDHNCLVAFTSDADFDGHYNHYCKEVCVTITSWAAPQLLTVQPDFVARISLPDS